jgi:hypothetical protein
VRRLRHIACTARRQVAAAARRRAASEAAAAAAAAAGTELRVVRAEAAAAEAEGRACEMRAALRWWGLAALVRWPWADQIGSVPPVSPR